MQAEPLKSAIENVVVLVRLCGRVFAVRRIDAGDDKPKVQIRQIVQRQPKPAKSPPDQSAALKLLRKD